MQSHQSISVERCCLNITFKEGSLVLIEGSGSIFASKLKVNVRYRFANCGVPVEIPSSARFDVEGDFTIAETLLSSDVFDLHTQLDAYRASAAIQYKANYPEGHDGAESLPIEMVRRGPRVIVVGDQNTGKTSLCRALVNMGLSTGTKTGITFIDLDVGQQSVTSPGSISASFLETPIPVDEGLNLTMPLCFFFGEKQVTVSSRKRYLDLCALVCDAVDSLFEKEEHFGNGGFIINTMGWIVNLGKDLIFDLCSIFSVTHIIVTGSDSDLEAAIRNTTSIRGGVEVLRFPRVARMTKRGANSLAESRTQQLLNYFSGTFRTPLSPSRGVVKSEDLELFNAVTLERLTWKDIKGNSLAAVVWADSVEAIGEANVAGFVILLEVGKQFISFLAPASGDLPKPFLLVSPTLRLPPSKVPPIHLI